MLATAGDDDGNSVTGNNDDGDGAMSDNDDGDGATGNSAKGGTTMDDNVMGSGAMGYDDDDDNGCRRGRDPTINKRWKGEVGETSTPWRGGLIQQRNN